MKIKELAETLKARPGMRIRLTCVDLFNAAGDVIYTPALTDAQIIAYGEMTIAESREDGNTIYCTVV